MSRPTLLQINLFFLVAALFHPITAVGQRNNDFTRQIQAKRMAQRRAKAPSYVVTLLETPPNHGGFLALDITPDGVLVAGGTGAVSSTFHGKTTTAGGDVLLWDAKTGKIVKTLGAHGKSVTFTKFGNNGKILVSVSRENQLVQIWDVRRKKRISRFELKSTDLNDSPAVTPNGRWLANVKHEKKTIGDNTVTLRTDLTIWDAKTGKPAWTLPESSVQYKTFSADSKVLVGVVNRMEWTEKEGTARGKSLGRELKAWNAATGDDLWAVDFKESINRLTRSRGAATVLGFGRKNKILSISLVDGSNQKPTQLDFDKTARTIAMTPDGKKLAVLDFTFQNFYLVDMESGKTESHVNSQEAIDMRQAAFSSDLKLMVLDGGFEVGPAVIDVEKMVAETAK